MPDTLRISIDELRRAADVLLDHVQTTHGEIVEIPDGMFWAVPADVRYDVNEQPPELTIGELGESLNNLLSTAKPDGDTISYGLVWLADILRVIGERTVS